MNNYDLMGVKVTLGDYRFLIHHFINNVGKTYACVNQYYLNLIYDDENYKKNISSFDIIHLDGIGSQIAVIFLSNFKVYPPRINGSDLYFKILKEIEKNNFSLYILGDSSNILNNAVKKILNNYPLLNIVGTHHGYVDVIDSTIVTRIKSVNPDVIFVGLGPKKQENWINLWKREFPNSRIIAIGGGLRVIAGDRKRGPKIIQYFGLEWFFRLLSEPHKVWRRYLIGIPKFIFRIVKTKLKINNPVKTC